MTEQQIAALKRYDPIAQYIDTGDYVGDVVQTRDGEFVRFNEVREALEAMRKDAERYRWLKMTSSPGAQANIMSTPWTRWDSSIDAYIVDAAPEVQP